MKDADEVLTVSRDGPILRLTLNRPQKRNALNERMAEEFERVLGDMDPAVRALVLDGNGPHFCSGLDLSEQVERTPFEVVRLSRRWHKIKDTLQFGQCPVIAALHGAVIGGGFELAATAHLRIADETSYFQLPEARRGIFIGGGGTVRIARLIGTQRLTDMLLTGCRLDVQAAERYGLISRIAAPGKALQTAMEMAYQVAENAPLVNYLVVQALPRIADMSAADGLFTESVAAGLSQVSMHAKAGMDEFLHRSKEAAAPLASGDTPPSPKVGPSA